MCSRVIWGHHPERGLLVGNDAIGILRLEETLLVPEHRLTRDATPVSRVKEVFAQFVPNENKRVRRFSLSGTFIR